MARKLYPRKSDIVRVLSLNPKTKPTWNSISDEKEYFQINTRQKKRILANMSFNRKGVKCRYYSRYPQIFVDRWEIRRLTHHWGIKEIIL